MSHFQGRTISYIANNRVYAWVNLGSCCYKIFAAQLGICQHLIHLTRTEEIYERTCQFDGRETICKHLSVERP
jgi:hypothetical protein